MKFRDALVVIAVLSGATAVHAQSAGDFILSVGWNHFRTQSGSQSIGDTTSEGETYTYTDRLTLSDADAFSLTGSYFFTDHIAGELTLTTPARFEGDGVEAKYDYANLSNIHQRNASILLKYYFSNPQEKFRPYVGVGISRALFDSQYAEEQQGILITAHQTSFQNKWAPVLKGGLSYQFNKHWIGSFSISYMPLETMATTHSVIDIAPRPGKHPQFLLNKTQVRLNPVITQLSIGYRF